MSELAEIRTVLFALKDEAGATRADIASLRRSIDDRADRLDKFETRLLVSELALARGKGRSTILGALGGGAISLAVAFLSRQWA